MPCAARIRRLVACGALALALGLPAAAHAALSGFGSNGLTYDAATTAAAADRVAYERLTGAGMDLVRVDFAWPRIQPASARAYDWSSVDAMFAAMPAGVRAIALFNNAPAWARDATQAEAACGAAPAMVCRMPPAESRLGDWQAFVAAALARYGSRIGAVEAWNEPNLVYFWRPAVDAARWARLVEATAAAARAARPGVTVISGGLVGGSNDDPAHDVGPVGFLEQAFTAEPGLADAIDQYGLHPYSRDECGAFGAGSWAAQRDFTTDACASAGWDMERMRWVLRRHDPGAPVAVTEFGYHTDGAFAVDRVTQADWLVRAHDWFDAQPDVSLLIIHTLFDTSWETSPVERSYGLVDAAYIPKPAWAALHARLVARAAVAAVPAPVARLPIALPAHSAQPVVRAPRRARPAKRARSRRRAGKRSRPHRHHARRVARAGG
jgi:hypothetical protein